jgi:hypothetical protein
MRVAVQLVEGKIIPARGNSQVFISQRIHVIELVGLSKLNFVVMFATHRPTKIECWSGKLRLGSANS